MEVWFYQPACPDRLIYRPGLCFTVEVVFLYTMACHGKLDLYLNFILIGMICIKVMNNPIKIDQFDLNQIKELQSQFEKTHFEFGSLYLEKMVIDGRVRDVTQKETDLQKTWRELQNKESKLIDSLISRYGEGSLNLKEGTFTPDKQSN